MPSVPMLPVRPGAHRSALPFGYAPAVARSAEPEWWDEYAANQSEASLLAQSGTALLGGLAGIGNLLDLPGSMVRDTLAWRNPLDQLLTPFSAENRITGRELGAEYGLFSENDPNRWELQDFAGFGAEILLDPLTYVTLGGSAVGKAGQLAKRAGVYDDIIHAGRGFGKSHRATRQSTTLSDVGRMFGEGTAQRESLESAARGMGYSGFEGAANAIGDETLGGLLGVGMPFATSSWKTVQGPKWAGEAVDALGNAAKSIPGVAPAGRAWNYLFDESAMGQFSEEGQKAARHEFYKHKWQVPEAQEKMRQVFEHRSAAGKLYEDMVREVVDANRGVGGFEFQSGHNLGRYAKEGVAFNEALANWEYLEPVRAFKKRNFGKVKKIKDVVANGGDVESIRGVMPRWDEFADDMANQLGWGGLDIAERDARLLDLLTTRQSKPKMKDFLPNVDDDVVQQQFAPDHRTGDVVQVKAESLVGRAREAGVETADQLNAYVVSAGSKRSKVMIENPLTGDYEYKVVDNRQIAGGVGDDAVREGMETAFHGKVVDDVMRLGREIQDFEQAFQRVTGMSDVPKEAKPFLAQVERTMDTLADARNGIWQELQERGLKASDLEDTTNILHVPRYVPASVRKTLKSMGYEVKEHFGTQAFGSQNARSPVLRTFDTHTIDNELLLLDRYRGDGAAERLYQDFYDQLDPSFGMKDTDFLIDTGAEDAARMEHAKELADWISGQPTRELFTQRLADDMANYQMRAHRAKASIDGLYSYLSAAKKGGSIPLEEVFKRSNLDVDKALRQYAKVAGVTLEEARRSKVSGEVVDAVGSMKRLADKGDDIENPILSAIDGLNRAFKTNVTVMFPGFHFRNFISGQVVNATVGDVTSPGRYGKAMRDAWSMATKQFEPTAWGQHHARVSQEVVDVFGDDGIAAMPLMEAHAKLWGEKTGKNADEWFEKLSVQRGQPGGGGDVLYHPAYHGGHKFKPEMEVHTKDGETLYSGPTEELPQEIKDGLHAGEYIVKEFENGRFRLDKIGTGEGAQAYGWGLYFADKDGVARSYKEALEREMGGEVEFRGLSLDDPEWEDFPILDDIQEIVQLSRYRNKLSDAYEDHIKELERKYNENIRYLEDDANRGGASRLEGDNLKRHQRWEAQTRQEADNLRERIQELQAVDPSDIKIKTDTGLYKVDLAPEQDEYLDWDKPLNQQSKKVQEAIRAIDSSLWDDWERRSGKSAPVDAMGDYTGGDLYKGLERMMEGDSEMASRILRERGIRGNKYLDASSRNRGEGSHNYVIFDDSDVSIANVLEQRRGGTPRGQVSFHDDGRRVITAFQSADMSTLVHEIGHVFRRSMEEFDPELLKKAAKSLGVGSGGWSREAEEAFASGFERYLRDGNAPTKELKTLFDQFKEWLTTIYKSISGTPLADEVSPELREVFDALITPSENQRIINELYDYKVIRPNQFGGGAEREGHEFLSPEEIIPKVRDPRQTYAQHTADVKAKGGVGARVRGAASAAVDIGDDVGRRTEWMNRVPLYLYHRRRGVAPAEAARIVERAHFDYSAATNFERQFMKRAFPFYSFSSNMAKLTATELMQRPGGRLAALVKATGGTQEQDLGTPEHVAGTASLGLGELEDGSRRYLTSFGLAHEDPLSFLTFDQNAWLPNFDDMLTELGSRANPIPKAMAELAFNESLFQRGPSGGRDLDDMDPALGRLISNVSNLAGAGEIEDYGGQALPMGGLLPKAWAQPLEHIIMNTPASRYITTAKGITDERKYEKPLVAFPGDAALANLLTGMRVTDVSPQAQEAVIRDMLEEYGREQLGARQFSLTDIPARIIEETEKDNPQRAEKQKLWKAIRKRLEVRRRERAKERKSAESEKRSTSRSSAA